MLFFDWVAHPCASSSLCGPEGASRVFGPQKGATAEGVEALEAWFSQYLPQAALAAFIPLSVLLLVFPIDPLTGVVFVLTAPLTLENFEKALAKVRNAKANLKRLAEEKQKFTTEQQAVQRKFMEPE